MQSGHDSFLYNIYKSLFDYNHDACYAMDTKGKFILFNEVAVQLTGYSQKEALEMSFIPIIADEFLEQTLTAFKNVLQGNRESFYTAIVKKDGTKVDLAVTAVPIYVKDKIHGIVGIARDITEKNNLVNQINYMAFHDELTGLPNRRLFDLKVDEAIKSVSDDNGNMLAFMYLDLDRFKTINDSLGHNIGDMVLKAISKRLLACLEGKGNDIASRQGGDEFIILLTDVTKDRINCLARNMLDTLSKPMTINGHELFVTPSIGISLYPLDGDNAYELLSKADMAMYHAKKAGRNNYQFYNSFIGKIAVERLEVEKALRNALVKKEFSLYYQPIIDLKTDEIIEAEALIRWIHPTKGIIPPDCFISIAEETGMIVSIGEWVLREACLKLKKWEQEGLYLPFISVNLSLRQFYQQNLIQMINDILKEVDLEPHRLNIEITESMTMDVEMASIILHSLKRLGVSVSIDDFGTGYSSLSYLRTFPIDSLKIDRSFISDIGKGDGSENIAETIILLGHKLGLGVTAEGVEKKQHLEFLRRQQCNKAQGYLISQPLPEQEFKQLLSNWPKGRL